MLEFLWEFRQQRGISDAQLGADRAAREAGKVKHQTADHEVRLEAMALALMAMWSILEERLGVTEAQLVERMQRIDLSDGKLDGKVAPTATKCQSCKRVMSSRARRCIYCGGEALDVGPFSGL